MITLEELIQRTNDAKEAFQKAKTEVEMLTTKSRDIERSLPQLSASVSAAMAAKKKAMDLFAREKNSQKDVDAAVDKYAEAQRKELRSQEMLEATRRAKAQVEQELTQLRAALDSAEREVWQFIYDQARSEILKAVGDRMLPAYAAFQKTGGAEYGAFLRIFFGNQPDWDDVARMQKEIAQKNGIEI